MCMKYLKVGQMQLAVIKLVLQSGNTASWWRHNKSSKTLFLYIVSKRYTIPWSVISNALRKILPTLRMTTEAYLTCSASVVSPSFIAKIPGALDFGFEIFIDVCRKAMNQFVLNPRCPVSWRDSMRREVTALFPLSSQNRRVLQKMLSCRNFRTNMGTVLIPMKRYLL